MIIGHLLPIDEGISVVIQPLGKHTEKLVHRCRNHMSGVLKGVAQLSVLAYLPHLSTCGLAQILLQPLAHDVSATINHHIWLISGIVGHSHYRLVEHRGTLEAQRFGKHHYTACHCKGIGSQLFVAGHLPHHHQRTASRRESLPQQVGRKVAQAASRLGNDGALGGQLSGSEAEKWFAYRHIDMHGTVGKHQSLIDKAVAKPAFFIVGRLRQRHFLGEKPAHGVLWNGLSVLLTYPLKGSVG